DISEIKDKRGCNCLFQAASKSRVEIFEDFINSGILPNNSQQFGGNTILHHCCILDSKKEITDIILTRRYCDPKITNFNGNTALHEAIISKNNLDNRGEKTENLDQIIDLLIESGGISDLKNNQGHSELNLASKYGYEDIATKISQKLNKSDFSKSPKNQVSLPQVILQSQNKKFEINNSSAIAA
ncbi:MAG: hypothetical protein FJ368_07170, partial [Pelagibacterales bacterium]|nr:hypothetical protein [Pelagibacterales bacterium]